MKALTLTQPWATLVAIGAKKIETRSWNTAYRGQLAIHAAKTWPVWAKDICLTEPFFSVLRNNNLAGVGITRWIADLPLGCIVATCRLVAVHRVDGEDWRPGQRGWEIERDFWAASEQEKAFGDYSVRRYMWFIKDVVPLFEPVPVKGALSLWECELV